MGSCISKSTKHKTMGEQLDSIQEQLQKQYGNSLSYKTNNLHKANPSGNISNPVGSPPPLDRPDRKHQHKEGNLEVQRIDAIDSIDLIV